MRRSKIFSKLGACLVVFICFALFLGANEALAKSVVEKVAKPVTITIAIGSGNHAVPAQHFQKEFTAKTGINIQLVTISHTELYEKVMVELIGETGAYDAVEYVYKDLADFCEGGFLRPVDDYIEEYNLQGLVDDSLPVMKKMYTQWKDKTYGLVYDGDIHSYYYRKDLFNEPEIKAEFQKRFGYELRPARTWDEYRDIAKFFKETDYTQYGCSEIARRGRMYLWWANRFFGLGGEWFDKDGKPAINSAAGIKAAKNFKECIKYAPPGVLEFEYPEHETAWVKGQIPQFVQWGDAWKDALLSPESKIKHLGTKALGIALTPGGHPILAAGFGFAFPKAAEHTEEAFRFIAWLTSKEQSTWSITHPESGIDAYLVKGHFDNAELYDVLAPEYLAGLKKCIANGKPDLRIPHGSEFLSVLDLNLSRVLAGEVDAKKALDDTAKEWAKILKKYYKSPTLPEDFLPMLEVPK